VPWGGRLDDRVRRHPLEPFYQSRNPSLPITHNPNIHAIATVAVNIHTTGLHKARAPAESSYRLPHQHILETHTAASTAPRRQQVVRHPASEFRQPSSKGWLPSFAASLSQRSPRLRQKSWQSGYYWPHCHGVHSEAISQRSVREQEVGGDRETIAPVLAHGGWLSGAPTRP